MAQQELEEGVTLPPEQEVRCDELIPALQILGDFYSQLDVFSNPEDICTTELRGLVDLIYAQGQLDLTRYTFLASFAFVQNGTVAFLRHLTYHIMNLCVSEHF